MTKLDDPKWRQERARKAGSTARTRQRSQFEQVSESLEKLLEVVTELRSEIRAVTGDRS